jgi:hypothetical protein
MKRIDNPINAVENVRPLALEGLDAKVGGRERCFQIIAIAPKLFERGLVARRFFCTTADPRHGPPRFLPIPLAHPPFSPQGGAWPTPGPPAAPFSIDHMFVV